MSLTDILVMDIGMRFKINIHDLNITVIKNKWTYTIIYPDDTSEKCFLYSSVVKKVKKFIPSDIELSSWKDL